MRCFVQTILLVTLLCATGFAETNRTVEEISVTEYREWLGEKESLWVQELDNLQAFAPERVRQLEKTRELIRQKATLLETTSDPAQAHSLKSDTQELVYAMEKSLEALYGELEQQSGPVLVLGL
ncbi:MAG: hypothetical protein WC423_26795 [Vulcanimicrobiota bacterium]